MPEVDRHCAKGSSGGDPGAGHQVTVNGQAAVASNPSPLTEATLHSATVTAGLAGSAFARGVSASSFEPATSPALAGLSISNAAGGRPQHERGESPHPESGRCRAGADGRGARPREVGLAKTPPRTCLPRVSNVELVAAGP